MWIASHWNACKHSFASTCQTVAAQSLCTCSVHFGISCSRCLHHGNYNREQWSAMEVMWPCACASAYYGAGVLQSLQSFSSYHTDSGMQGAVAEREQPTREIGTCTTKHAVLAPA